MKCYPRQAGRSKGAYDWWWAYPEADGIIHVYDFADGMEHGKHCECGKAAFDMKRGQGENVKVGMLQSALRDILEQARSAPTTEVAVEMMAGRARQALRMTGE